MVCASSLRRMRRRKVSRMPSTASSTAFHCSLRYVAPSTLTPMRAVSPSTSVSILRACCDTPPASSAPDTGSRRFFTKAMASTRAAATSARGVPAAPRPPPQRWKTSPNTTRANAQTIPLCLGFTRLRRALRERLSHRIDDRVPVDGLGYHGREPEGKQALDVRFLDERGGCDNGNAGGLLVLAKAVQQLDAVDHRHHDVGDDEVGRGFARGPQALEPVERGRHVVGAV